MIALTRPTTYERMHCVQSTNAEHSKAISHARGRYLHLDDTQLSTEEITSRVQRLRVSHDDADVEVLLDVDVDGTLTVAPASATAWCAARQLGTFSCMDVPRTFHRFCIAFQVFSLAGPWRP